MAEAQIIVAVRNYKELQAALRDRAEELQVSRETVDYVAGLPPGYAAKVLARHPKKCIGRDSMGPLLTVLGIKLLVVEDDEARSRYASRMVQRNEQQARNARGKMRTTKHPRARAIYLENSEWGRQMAARRNLKMSKKKRRASALKANAARWGHVTPPASRATNKPSVASPPARVLSTHRPRSAGTGAPTGPKHQRSRAKQG